MAGLPFQHERSGRRAYSQTLLARLPRLAGVNFGAGSQRQPPPPFAYIVSAVMNSHASEHMKSTSSAISSALPKRPIGMSASILAFSSGEVAAAAANCVSTGPGEID